ncbi:hypothetical protein SAMN05216215_101869 [Saccharopolyspora shandongensis]|uniref:Uncharacterized protein n=1 Tax=Saccharopolyspora shandongensis TaxID=418495 RepID=A0A1H3G6R7_9PSEU|nr:hypothetical protein [Saccharopolyspora shandongensis]SDX98976.1 hypothetical protein SAMN05216215_101869 [Saccharopolyspora shandongensis]
MITKVASRLRAWGTSPGPAKLVALCTSLPSQAILVRLAINLGDLDPARARLGGIIIPMMAIAILATLVLVTLRARKTATAWIAAGYVVVLGVGFVLSLGYRKNGHF